MATDVIMPALGMAQETGKIVRWLKAEGDSVVKGEPLMEVETDKVTVEVEAPADGVLGALAAGEGEEVPVGRSVAFILAPGESPPKQADDAEPRPAENGVPTAAADGARSRDQVFAEPKGRRPLASPKARRFAAEQGVDLAVVRGTGPHGAVVAADVESFRGGTAAAEPEPAPMEPLSVGSIWRRMAERTQQSWQTAPHFFLFREVDAGRLKAWRASARARSGYERVTHTDLLVKLCAETLAAHPRVNASWRDEGIITNTDVNVGIAVAVEDGLIVPVVHGADRLELHEIAERRTGLVAAAREGRLRAEDVAGGTFTISNLGMYGVDGFLAIVNPPQAAILAVGRIADRVVPVDGQPAVRPTMLLGLSFDHRVVDGARGAEFVDTLASLIEEPAGLVR
jgi:pyruvate dehydrogenase E2 component (dihydrolipoyllysine-residue acetyltransferase)